MSTLTTTSLASTAFRRRTYRYRPPATHSIISGTRTLLDHMAAGYKMDTYQFVDRIENLRNRPTLAGAVLVALESAANANLIIPERNRHGVMISFERTSTQVNNW